MIPIQFITQRRIIALPQEASASQAAEAMWRHAVGCIMVNNSKGHLVGIITDRDLACGPARKGEKGTLSLSEVMTPRPATVEPSADLELVIHLMEQSGVRRIPVVQQVPEGLECVGLITLDDLIASKLIEYDHLARVVRSQIRERKSTGLSAGELMPVTEAILSAIIRRIHYTGAAHLLNLLPDGLQEKLLELPSGPDPQITLGTLKIGLLKSFRIRSDKVEPMLMAFFQSLAHLIPGSEMDHLRSELPEEFAMLIPKKIGRTKQRAA